MVRITGGYEIIKTIEVGESHRFQLGATLDYVGGGVVIGNMGQTDGYLLHLYVSDEPTEIVDYLNIIYRSISTIDVGIHVLYIYYIVVDVWSYSLQMATIYIKRCFDSNVPVSRLQLAKGYYLSFDDCFTILPSVN